MFCINQCVCVCVCPLFLFFPPCVDPFIVIEKGKPFAIGRTFCWTLVSVCGAMRVLGSHAGLRRTCTDWLCCSPATVARCRPAPLERRSPRRFTTRSPLCMGHRRWFPARRTRLLRGCTRCWQQWCRACNHAECGDQCPFAATHGHLMHSAGGLKSLPRCEQCEAKQAPGRLPS